MNNTLQDPFQYNVDSRQTNAFNEQYFAGSDISLKFQGEVVSGVSSLQFQLQEQMKPIYGYQSRLFDAMAIGNRVVIGSFSIPISNVDKIHEVLTNAEEKLKITEAVDFYGGTEATIETAATTATGGVTIDDSDGDGLPDNLDEYNGIRAKALAIANANLGKKYEYNADGPDSFDARGLIEFCYTNAGCPISLAYSSSVMSSSKLDEVSPSNVKAGDIVLEVYEIDQGNEQVVRSGIYIDGSQMYTSKEGKGVIKDSISGTYNKRYYAAASLVSYGSSSLGGSSYAQAEIQSVSTNTTSNTPLTARDWYKRYNGRQDMSRIRLQEFSYIPHDISLQMAVYPITFNNLPYMPIDKVSKVVFRQSYTSKASVIELQDRAKIAGKNSPNIHFLVKKSGVIEQCVPICCQVNSDNSIVIMVEGGYNTPMFNDGTPGDNENVQPPEAQIDACIKLLYDLSIDMTALRVATSERELRAVREGAALEDCADPGVLFPMYKIVDDGPLNSIGGVHEDINDQIVTILGMDSIYGLESFNEVSTMVSTDVMVGSDTPANDWFLSHTGFTTMTSPYAKYRNLSTTFGSSTGYHSGIDYGCPIGTTVATPVSGTVKVSKNNEEGFGQYVCVQDKNGMYHVFAHLSKRSVNVGDELSAGDVVGVSGDTGNVSGPHLHYAIHDMSGSYSFSYATSKDPNEYLTPTYGFPEGGESSIYVMGMGDFERNIYVKSPNMYGADIRELQKVLVEMDVFDGSIDGYYGPRTHAAVKSLKDSNPTNHYSITSYEVINGVETITEKCWNNIKNFLNYLTGGVTVAPTSTTESATTTMTSEELKDSLWNTPEYNVSYSESNKPFFYPSGVIRTIGFDLSIQYGYHDDHKIKKIKNMFIRSLGQGIDTSGQAIVQMFEFVARDFE